MLACSTGKYDGVRIFQKSSKIPTLSESFLLFTLAIRKSTIKDVRMGVSHRDFLEHCKRVAKFCYSLLFLPCKHTHNLTLLSIVCYTFGSIIHKSKQPDKLEFTYSISVRIVNTLGRLKISFFKNSG